MAFLGGDDSLSSRSKGSASSRSFSSRSRSRSPVSSRSRSPVSSRSRSPVSSRSRSRSRSPSRSPSRSRSGSPRSFSSRSASSRSAAAARSAVSSDRSRARSRSRSRSRSASRSRSGSPAGSRSSRGSGSRRSGSSRSRSRSRSRSPSPSTRSMAQSSVAMRSSATGALRLEDEVLEEEEEEELAVGMEFMNRETGQMDVAVVLEAITGANKLRARRALDFYLDAFLVSKQFARRGKPLPALVKKLGQVAFTSDPGAMGDLRRILEVMLFLLKSDSNASVEADKEGATPVLLSVVNSGRAPIESRIMAARALSLVVTPTNTAAQANLVGAGGVPLLCKLLASGNEDDLPYFSGQILSRLLVSGGKAIQLQVLKSGGMHGVVRALRSRNVASLLTATQAVHDIVKDNRACQDGFRTLHGLSLLVGLLTSDDLELVTAVARALTALAQSPENASELFYATAITSSLVRVLRAFPLEDRKFVAATVQCVAAVYAGDKKRQLAFIDEGVLIPLTQLVNMRNEDARVVASELQLSWPQYIHEMHPKIEERLARQGVAEPEPDKYDIELDLDYFADQDSDEGDDVPFVELDDEDFVDDNDERGYDMVDAPSPFWPGTGRNEAYSQWVEYGITDEMALAVRLEPFSTRGDSKAAQKERALRERERQEFNRKARLREIDGRIALLPSQRGALENENGQYAILLGLDDVRLAPPPPMRMPDDPLPLPRETKDAKGRPYATHLHRPKYLSPEEEDARLSNTPTPKFQAPRTPFLTPGMKRFAPTNEVSTPPTVRAPAGGGWYREQIHPQYAQPGQYSAASASVAAIPAMSPRSGTIAPHAGEPEKKKKGKWGLKVELTRPK